MTVAPSFDPAGLLEEQLAQASPDLLRELLGTFSSTHFCERTRSRVALKRSTLEVDAEAAQGHVRWTRGLRCWVFVSVISPRGPGSFTCRGPALT